MIIKIILLSLAAYLIGSINFSIIISKAKNIDIKKVGSGNAGATNMTRALGKKMGVLVFFLDFFKGVFPCLVARILNAGDYTIIVGLFVVIGHIFPLYYGFKGGKGVSTTFGAIATVNIWCALILGVLELVLIKTTKIVSISTLLAFILLPLTMLLLNFGYNYLNVYISGLYTILVIFSHRSNIKKLLNGTENSFKKQ